MKDIVLKRSNLNSRSWRDPIESIDLFTSFVMIKGQRENFYQANNITFIDDDGSYKILKSRYGEHGITYKFIETVCSCCEKEFKTMTHELYYCPYCDNIDTF